MTALALASVMLLGGVTGCARMQVGPLAKSDVRMAPSGPWPMERHDAQATARATIPGPESPQLKWTYAFPVESWSDDWICPVVAADGTVYLPGSQLRAIDTSGALKWQKTVSAKRGAALGGDGTICVASDEGRLWALDSHGATKWTYDPGSAAQGASAIGPDGTIYVQFQLGLHAFGSNGVKKWLDVAVSPDCGGLVISPADAIYAYNMGDGLTALNADGAVRWKRDFGNPRSAPMYPGGPAAICADGNVVIASADELTVYSPAGKKVWQSRVETVGAPAIASDGTIYAGGADGMHAVSATGTQKWLFPASWASPAIIDSNGTIYFGAGNTLYALNPDGKKKWAFTGDGKSSFLPLAIGVDRVLYASLGSTETSRTTVLAAIGSTK